MWARQLGLRPGLRPDAMLSLQRGRCCCLKCTFWHAAWCTGWEEADGEGRPVSLSCWSSGKNLELHFKWIDGRREADAAAEQHQKLLAQPKLQSTGRGSGNGERGTGARAWAIARARAIMEGSFGPKNRIEQRMWDDIWRCLDNPWKSTCVSLCMCFCFCMCTTCVTSRAKSPDSLWSRGKCRCRCIYHPPSPQPPLWLLPVGHFDANAFECHAVRTNVASRRGRRLNDMQITWLWFLFQKRKEIQTFLQLKIWQQKRKKYF